MQTDDEKKAAVDSLVQCLADAVSRADASGMSCAFPGVDSEAESYFQPHRSQRTPEFSESLRVFEVSRLAAELESLWKSEGREELVDLAREIGLQAETIRAAVPRSADVTPYVYEMF